jgi:hypothetical protein
MFSDYQLAGPRAEAETCGVGVRFREDRCCRRMAAPSGSTTRLPVSAPSGSARRGSGGGVAVTMFRLAGLGVLTCAMGLFWKSASWTATSALIRQVA